MIPDDLVSHLTLEEKASLLAGKDYWETRDLPAHGLPSVFLADGPHGVRRQARAADKAGLNAGIPATCFPTAATVANSWNTDLGEKVGQYLGTEARAQGVGVLLGPGLNMKRSPRCGRNFEYFSEDPYLAGKMAAAYVRGLQSQGVSACVKHFAARNQETGAMAVDVVADERTLREIYLTAFEIAVTEGNPWALMSSSNKINGEYVNESRRLLTEVLRQEWGFRGAVVTDWGGSADRIGGLRAGSDLEMPGNGGQTAAEIVAAVRSGALDEALVDQSARRLVDLVRRTSGPRGPAAFDVDRHHRVSQRMAEESIVLLKNEGGLLPLPFGRKAAFIGEFARQARYQGAGSSIVNPTVLDHTLACFEESGITSIGFEPGFERYGRPNRTLVAQACALAARAETVLLYLGLDEDSEAQGVDRATLALPANQVELLEAVAAVNPNLVVVLSCGSVIEMPWIGRVKALVHGYLGGQAGARALLRVISGDVNPSGKLAETYPLADADTPVAGRFPGPEATAEYREGLYVGYRYYDSAGVPVLFPFGHGLSYTAYEYSDLAVGPGGVTFRLANTGVRAGMEVAQLYVGRPSPGRAYRPLKQLKGFTKVFLNAGQAKTVSLAFDAFTFRYWDEALGRWAVEAGTYEVWVGASSADLRLAASVTVAGDAEPLRDDRTALPSYWSARVASVSDAEFEALLGRPRPPARWDRRRPLGLDDTLAQTRYARGAAGRLFFAGLEAVHGLAWALGRRSWANLLKMSVYNLPFRGIARMSGGAVGLETARALVDVANGRGLGAWGRLVLSCRRH